MKMTKYHTAFDTKGDKKIVFNIMNGKIIEISQHLYNRIMSEESFDLSILDIDKKRFLENNFFVESDECETKLIRDKLLKLKNNSDILTVTILTNLDCNMDCKYCHENGFLSKVYMGRDEQNRVIEWIVKQLDAHGYRKLSLYFYGGEPLLNVECINHITNEVILACRGNGIQYDFSISTNGTLLTNEIVQELINSHISSIQVSIDGDKDIHDIRRPMLTGEGSFETIFENITKCLDLFSFFIRVNVDKQNYTHIERLIQFIVDNNLHEKAFFYLDFVSATHNMSEHCDNYIFTTLEEMKSITYLWGIQTKLGVPLHGKNIFEGLCGNICKSNVTISPLGEIYTCPGLCGIKELQIGTVARGFNSLFDELEQVNIWEQCLDCKYVPMCAGGCRAQAYMKTGSCLSCYCRKNYYDTVIPEYIKYKYNYSQ